MVEPRAGEAGVTPDVLVHRADRAMYAGKRQGKGIAVHYRPELGATNGHVGDRDSTAGGRTAARETVA
jgi:hypothetical protein